jgi:hypothetical protein
MAKKKEAVQSTKDKKPVKENLSEDFIDDDEVDAGADFDEDAVLERSANEVDQRVLARRRLEDYMEERRLREELGDDFDLMGDSFG